MVQRVYSVLVLFLALADASDVKTIVARLEARYRAAITMQAAFLERYSESGRVVRVEAGTAYFHRPGMMRWQYESPEHNVFLVDGKHAWFYVPSDHTVTRVSAKQSTDWRTPLALLAGEMKVSRVCAQVKISSAEKPSNLEGVVLSCELKRTGARSSVTKALSAEVAKEDLDEQVYFEVNGRTGDLERILLPERGGVRIEFQFRHWQFNAPVPDSFFRFAVPRGVAIVNGELPSGERDGIR